MNFNKSHVSRNLLDYTTVENTSYATATLISGGITISGQYYVRFSSVSFTVGRSYTMSWTEKSISGTVKIMWRFQYLDGTYSVMPSSGMSLIAEKEVSALLLYVNGSSTESGVAEITNIMLNEGSTPLPYEPYSSEVWHDIPHYVHKTATDTITTLPAVIYPNDTTATVGLKGQTVQSSTPSPTSPVTPNGCGERTGNLFDKNATNTNNGYISNGYVRSDGSINTNTDYRVSEYIRISQNQQYNLYYGTYLNNPSVCFYDSAKNYISGVAYAGQWDVPFTTPQNAEYLRLSFRAIDASKIILNLGSVRLPYEPYGVKIPISSTGQTTSVYLGEAETTRKVKKLVLDGTESYSLQSINSYGIANFYIRIGASNQNAICTHLSRQTTIISQTTDEGYLLTMPSQSGQLATFYMRISSSTASTVAELQEWIAAQYSAGTPVCVWYVLATPETAVVNEPLQKIGDYADTVSNISIPVAVGGDTLSVDTTVQPSEVTVNYKGWHPVADVHERDNGAWT